MSETVSPAHQWKAGLQPSRNAVTRLRAVNFSYARLAALVPADSRRAQLAQRSPSFLRYVLPLVPASLELVLLERGLKRLFARSVWPTVVARLDEAAPPDDATEIWLAWKGVIHVVVPAWIGPEGIDFVQQHSARFLKELYPRIPVTRVHVEILRRKLLSQAGLEDLVV